MTTISARRLTLGYQRRTILRDLSLDLPEGRISVLVGSNGCGKSTLLKALARLLDPWQGQVSLDGHDIRRRSTRAVARVLSLLPQHPVAPEGISVRQLVCLGRHPHQSWLSQWSEEDERRVDDALERTAMRDQAQRRVETLSGGQRQRAWIAMAVAQDTPLMLLDEPTSFLDLTHQMEVLELLKSLNREAGKTIVMVLHDLNLACRYADHIVAVRDGRVHAQGAPPAVITRERVREIFQLECRVIEDPFFHTPLCIPFGKERDT
ncbi:MULTISPECIES: ABC transporter ATP-binding protein [unclassified Modicisalibacter]|uniref:ABC transporter ATP-binding protein n=1 Tax=unclassified Modicisalibacter TaxID=2679913 RepID=UPI001CCE1F35|nr:MULTISPECIES: ABC transporter ATP-binding protein [unclassified Modicisalibacter]MBZ9558625.1 ABC transporter ATP-binding protein [Modicisalibacter sp. R2A 31.J]MBZ9575483.1 ABC transporter ATP-binding protein [Modicisalibacter sp. MOD 31.J]